MLKPVKLLLNMISLIFFYNLVFDDFELFRLNDVDYPQKLKNAFKKNQKSFKNWTNLLSALIHLKLA